MTITLRNVLLTIAILFFGTFAVRDLLRHDVSTALRDGFVGSMVCYVILLASKARRRPASEP